MISEIIIAAAVLVNIGTATMQEAKTQAPIFETEVISVKSEVSWTAPMPAEHLAHVVLCCKKYKVPIELVLALIERESGFVADAVSATNDYGYMQINKCHFAIAEKYHFLFPKENPFHNIEYGVWLLRENQKTYGSWEKALMLYAKGYKAMESENWERGFDTSTTALLKRAEEIRESGGVF